MNHKDLIKLIQQGENEKLEFKKNFNDAAIETLVAFANTSGGMVCIGINNDGKPQQLTLGKETIQKWVNEIKNKTQPAIIPHYETVAIDGKEILLFSVNEFPVKPLSFKGRYYKRIKNANHQLNANEITEMNLQSLQLSWDSYITPDKTIADLDSNKVNKFIQKVNTSGRFNMVDHWKQNLEKLKLISGNKITHAAWLLFSKESTSYNVHLGRFKTPSMIIDDKMFNGTLFEVVESTMNYLLGQIKVAFEITGKTTQRNEIFEYPLPALRELVLNAIIHRDYMSPIDVQIKIFDQKITFFNPGSLFGKLSVAQLKKDNYQAYTRNKLIAEAFYLTGDIEKYGSGFVRIREEIKTYPTMKFDFEEVPNGFLVTLHYAQQKSLFAANKLNVPDKVTDKVIDNVPRNVPRNVTENVPKNAQEMPQEKRLHLIILLIKKDTHITMLELSKKIRVTHKTIKRDIGKLKIQGVLKRIGPTKGGYWKILNE